MNRRIVLIGFSATGKSTVARLLAARLGWDTIDTDDEIVRRTGQSIPDIFHGQGEDAFRAHERAILKEACSKHTVCIAAGGGAVLVSANRRLFERTCYIVCLEARPETIYARLLADKQAGTNPVADILTRGHDPVERIAYLKEFRQPYYTIAHWTVHTDYLTPDEVAEEIMHGWTYYCRAKGARHARGAQSRLRYPLGDARESDAPYADGRP